MTTKSVNIAKMETETSQSEFNRTNKTAASLRASCIVGINFLSLLRCDAIIELLLYHTKFL
jgi:hypothetical protein